MTPEFYLRFGIILANKGAWQQAADYFRRAAELKTEYPEACANLGSVLTRMNHLTEAEDYLRRAIELNGDYPEAFNNLGVVLQQTNRYAEAQICFKRAIELRPNYTEAYINWGEVWKVSKRRDEAKKCFYKAIRLNPNSPEAYNSLGVCQAEDGLLSQAENCFRRAIELKKFDYLEATNNLGIVLIKMKRIAEAEVCIRRASELWPECPEVYNNLGLTLKKTNCMDEAAVNFRRALALRPDYPAAYINLGLVLKDSGRLDEAETCFQHVLKLHEDCSEADFALGILYLLQGQYEHWWEKYELRRSVFGYRQLDIRRWKGEELAGRRILLFYEQGYGDSLHFVRYASKVVPLASAVILWVQEPLGKLLSDSLPGVTILTKEPIQPEQYDFACPLPSLPFVFNTVEENIPRTIPYIRPRQSVAEKWRKILDQRDGGHQYRVGIAWAGNPRHANDHNRTITVALFETLLDMGDINWVSLQVGDQAKDLTESLKGVVDFSQQLVDFSETAGIIDNLDLIITVDSAVAHLAGAMGKKTWTLLPFAPDWRWQLEREDSPWYPTMRLFRQQSFNNWQEVFVRVKTALKDELMRNL